MLNIRQKQYKGLAQYALDRFVLDMETHLKARCPEETDRIGDAPLRELIAEGVERAEGFAIVDANDVRRYLEYVVRFGLEFGDTPPTAWARPFLNDRSLDGSQKMNRIDDYELFVLTLEK